MVEAAGLEMKWRARQVSKSGKRRAVVEESQLQWQWQWQWQSQSQPGEG